MISKSEFEDIVIDFLNGYRITGVHTADSVENVFRACSMDPEVCIELMNMYQDRHSIDEMYYFLKDNIDNKHAVRLAGYKNIPGRNYNQIMNLFCYIVDFYAK